jgi:hypothetical protein
MVMYKAFADDSGKGSHALFAIGGLVAPASRWEDFTIAWDAALKRQPKIDYFNLTEAVNCTDQFEGFSPDETKAKIDSLLGVIEKFAEYGLVVGVNEVEYVKRLKKQVSKTLDSPYFHLAMLFINIVLFNQFRKMDPLTLPFFDRWFEPVDFIFDLQYGENREVESQWQLMLRMLPPVMRMNMGEPPIWRDEKCFLPLQAADLIVGLARRANERDPKVKPFLRELSIPLHVKIHSAQKLAEMTEILRKTTPGYETAKMRSRRHKGRKK